MLEDHVRQEEVLLLGSGQPSLLGDKPLKSCDFSITIFPVISPKPNDFSSLIFVSIKLVIAISQKSHLIQSTLSRLNLKIAATFQQHETYDNDVVPFSGFFATSHGGLLTPGSEGAWDLWFSWIWRDIKPHLGRQK